VQKGGIQINYQPITFYTIKFFWSTICYIFYHN